MGFFSQGNYGNVDYLENVNEDSRYSGYNGAYRSLVEGYENDRIMFEAMLSYDFQEAALITEGAGSDELMALNENMITSFFSKLKELFKKLWSKIKAIFHGFIAKFSAKLGSDNKAFAKKYRKEIYRKNLTNFEAKYEKPKKAILDKFLTLSDAKVGLVMAPDYDYKDSNISKIESMIEDWDEEEEEAEAISLLSGCKEVDSTKEFEKTIHEWCFEDKDTIEGEAEVKAALIHLEGADKTISNIKKSSDKIQSCIQDVIKKIDDMDKNFFKNIKAYPNKTSSGYTGAGELYTSIGYDSDSSKKAEYIDKSRHSGTKSTGFVTNTEKKYAQLVINLLGKEANTLKNAFNKVSASCLKEAKFYIAQDRMLVAKAVAYRPKNESTELVSQEEMDFFGDIAAWEVETELR